MKVQDLHNHFNADARNSHLFNAVIAIAREESILQFGQWTDNQHEHIALGGSFPEARLILFEHASIFQSCGVSII